MDGFEILELDSTEWKTFDELRIYLYQDPEGYYNYMISWPDGREFFSSFYKNGTEGPVINFNNKEGCAGYYQLLDNEILSESYAARRFLYDHYEMRPDGTIIWTKRQTRIPGNGWKLRLNEINNTGFMNLICFLLKIVYCFGSLFGKKSFPVFFLREDKYPLY